ncbi:MAG: hypothetical protein M3Q81_02690, partial [bacterium]|nr:hypothetical protein [bacterium]
TTKLESLRMKALELEDVTSPQTSGQINRVNLILPSRKPLLELLGSLNAAAASNRVSFQGIELSPGSIATEAATTQVPSGRTSGRTQQPSAAVVESMKIELSLSGELANISQFIESIENTAPLTTVTKLSLANKGSENRASQEGIFTASLAVETYFYTRTVSSAIETALPKLTSQDQGILRELEGFALPEPVTQAQIMGGGLGDLFGVSQPELEEVLQ